MAATRWLFYAINGEGVGHLTRQLALARQLRKRSPDAEYLFLTSCEAVSLAWNEGFASIKTPSQTAVNRNHLGPDTRLRLIHTITPNVIACYDPHVFVVDTVPGGTLHELLPILRWPLKRVFIYREQHVDVVRSASFQQVVGQYHRVIVPHEDGEGSSLMPPQTPVEYVGHMLLRSRNEGCSREEARNRLGLPHDRTVIYVGFGGGGDLQYFKILDWVLKQAADFPHFHFACPRPPLARQEQARPQMPNVSWFQYSPMAECWSAFDGAISAVGYNTTGELLHHGVPTIWIPLKKKRDDQHRRAERAVQRGAGWLVRQEDTAALRAALAELARPETRHAVSRACQQLVPVNGAERAADSLLQWIASSP